MMMFLSLWFAMSFSSLVLMLLGSARRVNAITCVISLRRRTCCIILLPMAPVAPTTMTFIMGCGWMEMNLPVPMSLEM